MAFTLGPVLQSIGDTGSQAAGAQLAAAREKIQRMFDQLALNQGQSSIESIEQQIAESKERMKRMGLPQPMGTVGGPQGEVYGVTFDPEGGFKANQIIAGKSFASWGAMLHQMIEHIPPDRKALATSIADYWTAVGEPDKAVASIKELAIKPEARPSTPEEQYIEAKVRENNNQPLTSDQLREAHEKYQPYGQQKLVILQSNLSERKKQNLLSDIAKLDTATKRYEKIIDVGGNVPGYVSNPTGPGDAALLLAFVEAIRPASGFRFTETERKMFIGLRGVVDAAQARLLSGYEGTLFGPQGSPQREQMAQIVTAAKSQAETKKSALEKKFIQANPELGDLITPSEPTKEQNAPQGGGGDTDLYFDAQGNLVKQPQKPQ